MRGYGLPYRSTMCNPKIYSLIFCSNFHIHESFKKLIALICFSSHEKRFGDIITPPRRMQTPLFYQL